MDFELEGNRKRQGSSNENSAPCTSSSQPNHLSNNHVPSNGFFNNSRQIHVSGGTYNYIHQGNNPNFGFQQLLRVAVATAMHTSGESFDRPGCYENTRVAVLKYLLDWISWKFEAETFIMWLYGDAGAGKSAIAQTLAMQCDAEKSLLASFFFSKNDPRRSTDASFAATLVYQLLKAVPALKAIVSEIIEADPLIFEQAPEIQISSLFVKPINELLRHSSGSTPISLPHLIIVDGLDECGNAETQYRILKALLNSCRQCDLPLKVLVACRPEVEITSSFNSDPLVSYSTRLALDTRFKPEEDIRIFLTGHFESIKATHPLKNHIPSSWPSNDVVRTLVRRSSGQFIYASTIVKYFSSPRHKPTDRLEKVLGLRPLSSDRDLPFAVLDALYVHLLLSIPPENLEMVLKILGLIVIVQPVVGAYGAFDLRDLTWLSLFLSVDVDDIELYLADLSSVIRWEQSSTGPRVHVTHASLSEFLLDSRRSQHLHIKQSLAFAEAAQITMRHIKSQTDGVLLRYGYTKLLIMLRRAKSTPGLDSSLSEFSLPEAALFFAKNEHLKLSKVRVFLTFALDFLSIIREMTDTGNILPQHQQHFDYYMRLFLTKYSHTGILLAPTLLGLQHPKLKPKELDDADHDVYGRLLHPARENPLVSIFSPYKAMLACQPPACSSTCPIESMLLKWQPVPDCELLFEWCTKDSRNEPETRIWTEFFTTASRACEFVLDGAQYARAAVKCFYVILEAQMVAGVDDATYQTDFGTSPVVAYVYLPQLLERSSYSQELFDIIDGTTRQIHMRSKDIPLGDRLIKPELERLLPNVMKAIRTYACHFSSIATNGLMGQSVPETGSVYAYRLQHPEYDPTEQELASQYSVLESVY